MKPRRAKTSPPPAKTPPAAALLPVLPFPRRGAQTMPGPTAPGWHDLGPIRTPAEQAAAPGANLAPHVLEADAVKVLDALTGSGPRQAVPHSGTAYALEEGLARLRDHALAGDADAFAALGFVLRRAVADFHEIARRQPALAAAWGENQNTLPALTGKNPGHRSDLEAAFALFRLGEKSPYRVNPENRKGGKAPDASNPVNALAAGLCEHLAAHRRPVATMRPPVPKWASLAADLPTLSRDTARQWSEAALKLLESTFENPAELVKYCSLGDIREAEDATESAAPQVSAIRARIRRGIRELSAKV